MEKLVRGVIYDDVDTMDVKAEMFYYMDRMDDLEREGTLEKYIKPYAEDLEMTTSETIHLLKNMDAIAAFTRLNPETFKTHNMIIPKESLSKNLVKELSDVDLGKDMVNDYLRHYYNTYVEDEENIEVSFDDTVYNCNDFSSAEDLAKQIMITDPNNFLILGGDRDQINAVFSTLDKMKKVG